MTAGTAGVAAPAGAPVAYGSAEYDALIARLRELGDEQAVTEERPFESIALIKRGRLGALRLPVELGGAGATFRELFAVLIDVAAADPDVAHAVMNHYLFVEQLLLNPDAETRERWIPVVARGDIFGGANAEYGDVAVGGREYYAFRGCVFREDADGLRLDGEKRYSTGALFADWISVLSAHEGVGLLTAVIPRDREGVRLVDDWDGIGQRRTATGTAYFDNVRIHPEDRIAGWRIVDGALPPNYFGTAGALWLTAVAVGILQAVRDDAVRVVATRRRSFGHAPDEDPRKDVLLQRTVGEIAATAAAARATVLRAADALDAAHASVGDRGPDADAVAEAQLRSTLAKVHLDALATDAATRLFDLGAAAITRRSANLDRHWRNIRTLNSHNPVQYKAQAIGARLVNGTPFPANGYF